MQTIQLVSNSVSARPLGVIIREEIELLRGGEATTEQRSEIRRLEAMADRVREIDALGERILAAVIASPTPDIAAAVQTAQLRGPISATENRLAAAAPAKRRPRAARKPEKQVANS